MVETPRGPRLRDVAWPLLVAFSWAFHGAEALSTDGAFSGTALFVCLAFVLAGVGLGATCAVRGLRRAARLGRAPRLFGRGNPPRPADLVMMGLLFPSYGVSPVYEGATSMLDWAHLILFSATGGAFVGFALGLQQARIDHVSASRDTSRAGS